MDNDMELIKNKKPGFLLPGYLLPFIMVTILFFMWGIPNNLNGVLIKQIMKSMEISRFQAGLIQSDFPKKLPAIC
jgi:FHS family L-fucose permease-like MFS transporter